MLTKLYSSLPDGYCGDEDNGQTSAWYVFSSLGFYPVTPGIDQYVIGSPLFKKATLKLQNGNKMVLEAPNNSAENFYIDNVQVNRKEHPKNYFDYTTIQNGGHIQFNLSEEPNLDWASKSSDVPYSYSKEN